MIAHMIRLSTLPSRKCNLMNRKNQPLVTKGSVELEKQPIKIQETMCGIFYTLGDNHFLV